MKRTGIAAALFTAMLATPAMACIDWKAIVELDAISSAEIRSEIETAKAKGHKPHATLLREDSFHKQDVITDKAPPLAAKSRETARCLHPSCPTASSRGPRMPRQHGNLPP